VSIGFLQKLFKVFVNYIHPLTEYILDIFHSMKNIFNSKIMLQYIIYNEKIPKHIKKGTIKEEYIY
jgi:hypothetical protein